MLRLVVKNTYLVYPNLSTAYLAKSKVYVLNNMCLRSYFSTSKYVSLKKGGKVMFSTSSICFNNNMQDEGEVEEFNRGSQVIGENHNTNHLSAKNNSTNNNNNNNNDNMDPKMNVNDDSIEGINDITVGKTEDEIKKPTIEQEEDKSEENTDDYLTTIFDGMEPYMNTYNVYTELRDSGFTPAQADEILNLLAVQLNAKLSKLSTKYSQNYELENERYLFESAQEELRVDVTRSREQHINELISLINILERDFHIISDELNSDFIQLKNDSQVAINDQKSENTLLSRKIILKIQETNHKITTELNSAMRSEIESLRWHLSRWGIIAILVALFSACTTFYAFKRKTEKKQTKNEFVPLVIYEPSEYDEDDYHTDLDKSIIA